MDYITGQALFYYYKQTLGLCAYRELLIQHYRERVRRVGPRIVAGRFDLEAGKAVIGVELADDLGLGVGDKLRISTPDGRNEVFIASGSSISGTRI